MQQLVEWGKLDEALTVAQRIKVYNHYSRDSALTSIVQGLAGQKKIDKALEVAQDIGRDSSFLAKALTHIVTQLAKQGQVERAWAMALDDRDVPRDTLSQIASYLSKEQLQEVLTLARTIGNSYRRAELLYHIAPYLTEEQLQEALAITQSIEIERDASSTREDALAHIATQMAKYGKLEGALAVAQDIESFYARRDALVNIAVQTAKRGKPEEALVVARDIDDSQIRGNALANIASYLTEEQLQEAVTMAQGIENHFGSSEIRNRALASIATQAAKCGKLEEALEITQRRTYILVNVAQWLAERGETEGALDVAQGIEGHSSRAGALACIATHLSGKAQVQVLQDTLAEVRDIKDSHEDSYSKAEALALIVPYLSIEQLQEALAIAQSASHNTEVLSHIAARLAELGQPNGALAVAQRITHSLHRAEALANIAKHLSGGQLQAMMKVVQGIKISSERAEALAHIAPRLAELSIEDLYPLWCNTLHVLSGHVRKDLVADLAALSPVIVRLDGTSALRETVKAIQDVGRWWP